MSEESPITTEVCLELSEMRRLGMEVPKGAEAYVRSNPAKIADYRNTMKVGEIADLVINLLKTGQ